MRIIIVLQVRGWADALSVDARTRARDVDQRGRRLADRRGWISRSSQGLCERNPSTKPKSILSPPSPSSATPDESRSAKVNSRAALAASLRLIARSYRGRATLSNRPHKKYERKRERGMRRTHEVYYLDAKPFSNSMIIRI